MLFTAVDIIENVSQINKKVPKIVCVNKVCTFTRYKIVNKLKQSSLSKVDSGVVISYPKNYFVYMFSYCFGGPCISRKICNVS